MSGLYINDFECPFCGYGYGHRITDINDEVTFAEVVCGGCGDWFGVDVLAPPSSSPEPRQ